MGAGFMITILKNNEKMRRERTKFKTSPGGYNTTKKTEYTFPKATTKQIKSIKKRLIREEKITIFKTVIITLFIVLALVFLFYASEHKLIELISSRMII